MKTTIQELHQKFPQVYLQIEIRKNLNQSNINRITPENTP